MKNTPVYGWPYPESGDHTRTWEYWQNLATAIENTVSAGLGWAQGSTAATQALTASLAAYPLTTLAPGSNAAHLAGGNLVIDRAGTYLMQFLVTGYIGDASPSVGLLNAYALGGTVGAISRSGGVNAVTTMAATIVALAAAAQVDLQISATNLGTNPRATVGRISLVRLGP